jgi:hypothetical protein
MRRDVTDEEDAALARLLSDTINDDRYLLLARIRAFEEDPRQDPAGAVTSTTAAPIRHREIHRAYKKGCVTGLLENSHISETMVEF